MISENEPPMESANDQQKQLLDAISRRLYGTLDLNDQAAIRNYVRQHARSSEDIASFHARTLALTIANRRDIQAGHVDAFVRRLERVQKIPDAALKLLLDAFSEHASKLCKLAWSQDEPQSRWIGNNREPRLQASPSLEDGAIRADAMAHPTQTVEAVEEDGMLRPDARFVAYLEKIGPHGKKIGEGVREKARSLWKDYRETGGSKVWQRWLDPDSDDMMFPRWAKALLQALWLDVVTPRLEREAKKPASLVMAVAEPVSHLLSRVRRDEERNGQRVIPLPGDVIVRIARDAATIGADVLEAIVADRQQVNRGLDLFGGVTSHRVFRNLIFTGHQQALDGNPDPRVVRIAGSWSTYAHDILGLKSKRSPDEVRDIIEAMHATELPLPPKGNYSRLLTRDVTPSVGRREGVIRLILGFGLLPDYVNELKQVVSGTMAGRRSLRLVPILDLPPFVGRSNEHGAQATLSMLLVAHIRDNAREIVREGGILLDAPTLARLAVAAGVPRASLAAIMDRWFVDGDDGPALLKRVGDRVTLGDAHRVARDFIEKGGRYELAGAEAGKNGARKLRARIDRMAQPRKKSGHARVEEVPPPNSKAPPSKPGGSPI